MASYLGGLCGDERQQLTEMLCHFVARLNEERARAADLERRLEAAEARLRFFEASHYGAI